MTSSPLPEGITAIRVPDDAEILQIAQSLPPGLMLVSDGRQSVIAPHVPAGWHRINVNVKEPA
jgi:hypothetical protein